MLRKILRLATILFFPLLAAHAAGGRDLGPPQGSLSVHLVDGPLSGYQEINLAIQAVQVASKGGWTTLGTPGQTFNLLALTGGVVATLVPGAALPAGRYNQIRLVLGTENSVKLADGSLHPLEVPSGLKSGVKVLVHFRVEPGAARDVWIDFDAPHSIQVKGTGASRKFLLRPVVRAYDKSSTGSVEGTFTDEAGQGLPGAQVHAEILDPSGNPAIARSAVTDADGHYILDLLPVDATYYVVSQPSVGGVVYEPGRSDGIRLGGESSSFTFDAAFSPSAEQGALGGRLLPTAEANQSDVVQVLREIAGPSGSLETFIVDSAVASLDAEGPMALDSETFTFPRLPLGDYWLQAVRTTLQEDGSAALSLSEPAAVTLTASGAWVNLNFP